MASHVSQCMAKACMCDTWQAMCVTHGMSCVTMHGLFKAYIYGVSKSVCGERQQEAVHGSSKEKEEEGKRGREERRRERKERKGEREEKERRKEKKKGEEERKKKEENEGVLRSEQA